MNTEGRRLMIETLPAYELYRWAEELFAARDYYGAAEVLEHLVGSAAAESGAEHDLGQARELLARSYYHSARLDRAAEAARAVLEREPTNAYAALLLARALERSSRPEAAGAHRLARALDGTLDERAA